MAKRGKTRVTLGRRSWTVVRGVLVACLKKVCAVLLVVRYLSPWLWLQHWRVRRSVFVLDADGSVTRLPSLWDRLSARMRSDGSTKNQILDWVQEKLPALRVNNFKWLWADGVTLCALMESLCPGACPRYDLLKPCHKLNNCRLGIKLAHKHLGIPPTIVTPEEMTLANSDTEEKIRQLLSLVKWAYAQKQREQSEEYERNGQVPKANQSSNTQRRRIVPCCSVKGTGLLVGLVGRRCKFDVFTPADQALNVHIAVRGPCGEFCSEKIVSMFPYRRMASTGTDEMKAVSLWKTGTSRLLTPSSASTADFSWVQGKMQGAVLAERPVEEIRIPFDYQCIEEGHFLVSFIPRNDGLHLVEISWHEEPIRGSPFEVNVADTIETLNQQGRVKFKQKTVSMHVHNETGASFPPEITLDSLASIVDVQPDAPAEPEAACGVTAAVLKRTSKVQRSISRSGPLPNSLSKKPTVTRRRILKRVITRGGQEFLIEEAPPTPEVLSRECSQDSDKSNRFFASVSNVRQLSLVGSSSTESSSRLADDDCLYPHVQPVQEIADSCARSIIDGLLEEVERTAARTASRSESPRRLVSRVSSAGNLFVPSCDTRYKCSPFSNLSELAGRRSIEGNDINSGILHRKVCTLRSYPLSSQRIAADEHGCPETMSKNLDVQSQSQVEHLDENDTRVNATVTTQMVERIKPYFTRTSKKEHDRENHLSLGIDAHDETNRSPISQTHSDPFIPCDDGVVQARLCSTAPTTPSHCNGYHFVEQWLATTNHNADTLDCKDTSFERDGNAPYSLARSVSLGGNRLLTDQSEVKDGGKNNGMLGSNLHRSHLRLSFSLPMLSKQWTAFEIDPDDDHLTAEEMESLSIGVKTQRKRSTLGTGELAESISALHTGADEPDPTVILKEMKDIYHSLDAQGDGYKLRESAPSSDSFTGVWSPCGPSPALSPLSSPTASNVNSRRSSFLRQDDVAAHKMNEDRCPANQGKPAAGNHRHFITHVSDQTQIFMGSSQHPSSTDRFDVRHLSMQRKTSPLRVKIPMAKVDKWTQVCHQEINNSTGWERPATYVRPRRRTQQLQIAKAAAKPTLQDDHGADDDEKKRQSPQRINLSSEKTECLPRMGPKSPPLDEKLNREEHFNSDKTGESLPRKRLLSPALAPSEPHVPTVLSPPRQSTIETTDSGFVDDSGSPRQSISPGTDALRAIVNGKPKIAANTTGLTGVGTPPTRTLLRPRFISGHRAVTRSRYRGPKILLDPELVSNSPTPANSSTEDERIFGISAVVSAKKKISMKVMKHRGNSDGRRSKWRTISQVDSVGVAEGDLKVRKGYRGGCRKRRVTFSHRVMLYRRSSSRASSRNSKEDSTAIKYPSELSPCIQDIDPQKSKIVSPLDLKPRKQKLKHRSQMDSTWRSQQSRGSAGTTDSADSYFTPAGKSTLPSQRISGISAKDAHAAIRQIGNAGIVKTERVQDLQQGIARTNSSLDSFDGYGVSAITRKDLLEELIAFSDLGKSSITGSSANKGEVRVLNQPTSRGVGNVIADSQAQSSSETCSEIVRLTEEIAPTDEKTFVNTAEQREKEEEEQLEAQDRVAQYLEANFGPHTQRQMSQLSSQISQVSGADSVFSDLPLGTGEGRTDRGFSEAIAGVPDPFRCHAFGAGLRQGLVGARNMFQVRAKTRGNGSLGVCMTGPRPRTVTETCITFTGDDLYEVTYEVTQPGHYILNIKWADFHIPESPFICSITY